MQARWLSPHIKLQGGTASPNNISLYLIAFEKKNVKGMLLILFSHLSYKKCQGQLIKPSEGWWRGAIEDKCFHVSLFLPWQKQIWDQRQENKTINILFFFIKKACKQQQLVRPYTPRPSLHQCKALWVVWRTHQTRNMGVEERKAGMGGSIPKNCSFRPSPPLSPLLPLLGSELLQFCTHHPRQQQWQNFHGQQRWTNKTK